VRGACVGPRAAPLRRPGDLHGRAARDAGRRRLDRPRAVDADRPDRAHGVGAEPAALLPPRGAPDRPGVARRRRRPKPDQLRLRVGRGARPRTSLRGRRRPRGAPWRPGGAGAQLDAAEALAANTALLERAKALAAARPASVSVPPPAPTRDEL